MPSKSESEKILGECCRVGKVITVSMEIKDQELATKLMGTMYNQNIEYFGVAVNSWGFYDVQAAYKKREALIEEENERHYVRTKYLNDPNNLRQMLEEQVNQEPYRA